MAKAQKNPSTVATKWAQNLGASTPSMQNGANAVQTAPGVAAAAAAPKMLQKVTAAIQSGKYANRVQSVSLGDWKNAYIQKGIPRVAQGAQQATPKMQAFYQEFLPVAAAVSQEVSSMPNATLEDAIARSATAIRRFAEFGKNRK